ncbi:MAG: DUF3135 domain-containing protein [Motiliproteus sp.]|nr:DUF3135 domain-containing protein [Motiliproteus sp.]MCW9053029.1 DUF3135 domain-containing protein [Motiliproteus sp.]
MAELPCFDELKALADNDPEAFENFRRSSCQEFICCLPKQHQKRMRAVQFRVDCEIARAKTPMAGLVKISVMMHDSFYNMREKLNVLNRLVFTPVAHSIPQEQKIVDLNRWRDHHDKHNGSRKKDRSIDN